MGASSFEALSPVLQAVTVGWSVLGPVAALGMGTGRAWGEAVMVAVASAEIVLGVDFTDAMAPAAIPGEDCVSTLGRAGGDAGAWAGAARNPETKP